MTTMDSGLADPQKLKTSRFAEGGEIPRFASKENLEAAVELNVKIGDHNLRVDANIVLRQEAASGKLHRPAVELAEELEREKKRLPDELVRLIQRKQELFVALFAEYSAFNRECSDAYHAAVKVAEAKAIEVLPNPKHGWTRKEIVACLTEKEREAMLWRPLFFEGTGVALELELNDARTLLARAMTGR